MLVEKVKMAMAISNSKKSRAAPRAANGRPLARRMGGPAPAAPWMARSALQYKKGAYAIAARKYMREEGVLSFKLSTPGCVKAKQILDHIHSNHRASSGLDDDKRIQGLLESWTTTQSLKGSTQHSRYFTKQGHWMQTITGATDVAAFEARYDIGAASTEIDIIKQHLGGTAGVIITCVRGPDMMAGRMEERAARATEKLYEYLNGTAIDPGPVSFEIRNCKIGEGPTDFGFAVFSAEECQYKVRKMVREIQWNEVAHAWGVSAAGTSTAADYIKDMKTKRGDAAATQQLYDQQADRTVMVGGITDGTSQEKLSRQVVNNLMKMDYSKEDAQAQVELVETREAVKDMKWFGRVVMKEKKSAEDLLMGSTLATPGEGGIGNAIFVQGKTMGSRVSAGKRKLGPDPISHLQPITGQSAAGAVGVVDEEKMLSRIKAIVDESMAARDARRDTELIEQTVNATLTALLTPGSRHAY